MSLGLNRFIMPNMTEPNASNLYARIAGFIMGVGEDIAKTFTVDAETIITGKW